MAQGDAGQNTNARVTMAVLGVKIDNLAEKIIEGAANRDKLWEAHLKVHGDQEARLRYVEKMCHDNTGVLTRISELEKWQEGQKVRTGKLLAIQTTVSTAIAGAIAWLSTKPQ